MITYDITPVSFFKHDYWVIKAGKAIAYIKHKYKDFDKIILTENNETYTLGGYRDVYQMGKRDGTIITAEDSGVFRAKYNIWFQGREFILKKTRSFLKECYTIFERYSEIGRIYNVSIFNRKRRGELTREVPEEIVLFMIWITIMLRLQPDLTGPVIFSNDF